MPFKALFLIPVLSAALIACASETLDPMSAAHIKSNFDEPINSFEACLISGQPVMESHPRQCAYEDMVFVEDIKPSQKGDKKLILFEIGPEISDCQGSFARRCMTVNGQLFYDEIGGFKHETGTTSIIEVERHQFCDPKMLNDCPMDVGVYRYNMTRMISERVE